MLMPLLLYIVWSLCFCSIFYCCFFAWLFFLLFMFLLFYVFFWFYFCCLAICVLFYFILFIVLLFFLLFLQLLRCNLSYKLFFIFMYTKNATKKCSDLILCVFSLEHKTLLSKVYLISTHKQYSSQTQN